MIKIGCWRQKIFWKKRTIKIKKVQKIISVWTYKLLYLTFVIYCIPNIHCVYVCGGRSMSTIVSLFWECLEEHMSYSVKCISCFMLKHLMTSWNLNISHASQFLHLNDFLIALDANLLTNYLSFLICLLVTYWVLPFFWNLDEVKIN